MNKARKDLLILFLSLIIIGSVCFYIEKAYALDEFIDDYINENNIQAKNNIVRNTTFNCMELERTLQGVSEDFITYTEVDGGGDITRTSDRITFTTMRRGADDYVYKDFGVDYFDDFTHNFTVSISDLEAGDASSTTIASVWGVTNTIGTQDEFEHGDVITLMVVEDGVTDDRYRYILFQYNGGIITGILEYSGFYNLATHYITIIKSGTRVDAYIYSDVTRETLLESIGDNGVDNTHRYFQPLTSCGKADDVNDHITGYVEYYFLGDLGFAYENDGYFYTTEVLTALTGNSIVLLSNTTIPSGDIITVEFSSNNNTWVDHNGNVGSDTLVDGNESIDIRDLSYTSLYMRFNFTDVGADSTPRLYQIRVITNDIVSGVVGGVYTGWILGIFILVPSIAILISSRKRSKR